MIILGKSVSDQAAEAIAAIEARLKKTVVYEFTDTSKTDAFGECDYTQPDAYYVRSKEALLNITKAKVVNIPFETNIIHELSHLCQIEENFPHTATMYNQTTEQNIGYYDQLGSLFVSSILDMNVDSRLKQLGYTSEYFYKHRINRAQKIARKNEEYKEHITFIGMAIPLVCLNVLYPGSDMEGLLRQYQAKNPGLINCVRVLSSGIQEIGYDTSDGAFRSLVFLFSAFNLFSTHEIVYNGKEYRSLDSVKKDYPDIRIAHP